LQDTGSQGTLPGRAPRRIDGRNRNPSSGSGTQSCADLAPSCRVRAHPRVSRPGPFSGILSGGTFPSSVPGGPTVSS
jgi:hypothetical protein